MEPGILRDRRDVIAGNVVLENIKHKVFNLFTKSVFYVFNLLRSKSPEADEGTIQILNKDNYHTKADLQSCQTSLDFDKELIYHIASKPLGYCLLLNNINFENKDFENRYGSRVDADCLQSFFARIGYEVYCETDKKAYEMVERINKFSEMFNSKGVDSSIVIILSHGGRNEEGDYIFGIDGHFVLKKYIISLLGNMKCKQMQGKPKIFFFIACRGTGEDRGTAKLDISEYPDSAKLKGGDPSTSIRIMPTITDVLVVHSSLPDHVSMLEEDKGSWFCQDFISVVENCYSKYDLEDIIKMTNNKLMTRVSARFGITQVAHLENYGFKKFFLSGRSSIPYTMENTLSKL